LKEKTPKEKTSKEGNIIREKRQKKETHKKKHIKKETHKERNIK